MDAGGLYARPVVGGAAERLRQPYFQVSDDPLTALGEFGQGRSVHFKVRVRVRDRQVKRFQSQLKNSFSRVLRIVHQRGQAARSIRLMLNWSSISSALAAS